MGLITRLADRLAEAVATRIGPADRSFWLSDLHLNAAQGVIDDPYGKNAWVHRAVEIIAQNASSVPLRFYSGDEEDAEPISTPYDDFFADPNPELTPSAFWQLTAMYFLLPPGDAFWILEAGMDFIREGQIPERAWPVSGNDITAKVDETSGMVVGWEWGTGSKRYFLEPHQVVQFQLPNPSNPRRGMSPIEAAAIPLGADYQSDIWNEAVLKNGAQPAGILTFPNASAEQAKTNMKLFEGRHKGTNRAGKVGALAGDAKYQPLGFTHTEMGFQQQKEWTRQVIAGVYGVPLFLLTVMDEVHRETSKESMKLFWENTVTPHLVMEAGAINTRLLPDGIWCAFDLSEVKALQTEAKEKRETARADWTMGVPFNTVNARHNLGYEDQEGGDQGFIPVGVQPVSMAEPQEMPPDSALADVTEVTGDQEVEVTEEAVLNGAQIQAALSIVLAVTDGTLPRDAGLSMLEIMFNLTPQQAKALMGSAGMAEVPTTPNPVEGEEPEEPQEGPPEPPEAFGEEEVEEVEEEPEDEEEDERGGLKALFRAPSGNYRKWRAWLRQVQRPGEKQYRAAYVKWLRILRRETLAFVEMLTREVTDANIEQWLAERRDEWARELTRETEPIIEQIVGASADLAASEINLSFEPLKTPSILEIIESHGLERSKVLTDTVAKDVRRAVLKSVAGGGTVTEIQTSVMDAVKKTFNTVSASHSLTVARTESASAANESRAQTYKEGGVEQIEWVTAGDSEVRESHQIDGEVRTMGEAFSNGLRYPHDPSASAGEVINCRCTFIAAGEI